MKLSTDYLRRYLALCPAALALERSIECDMHARYSWPTPILDIGCGDGIFAKILRTEQIDTGIDLDPIEVKRARKTGMYRELIVCSAAQIPKPDESYATLVSNSVLEHIPDLLPVLIEASRLMAPDSRFYITVPSDRLVHATLPARFLKAAGLKSLAEKYGKFYNRFWRHYHDYDDAGWRSLFSKAGLEVIEHTPYVPRNLSTLYDFLTVLAFPSLIAKPLMGRWILWPWLRQIIVGPWHKVLFGIVHRLNQSDNGCLFFYTLKKRSSK